MSLPVARTADFQTDFAIRALWYVREAGADVARRYQLAVDASLQLLSRQPEMGRMREFRHPKLRGLRSFTVERPFNRLIIFYRIDGGNLKAMRLMHGSRNLRRRLTEPPDFDAD